MLDLLVEGKTSQEIASKLHIAVSTVIAHPRNINRKPGLHSAAELTKYAIREGMTPAGALLDLVLTPKSPET